MKKALVIAFLLYICHLSAYSQQVQNGVNIHLTVSNIPSAEGNIMLAVYNSEESFLEERYLEKVVPITKAGKVEYTFSLPPGTYAISVYHDENNNQELDSNFMGIPKESVGFSNNAKGTFGPASFEDAAFEVKDEPVRLAIKLTKIL